MSRLLQPRGMVEMALAMESERLQPCEGPDWARARFPLAGETVRVSLQGEDAGGPVAVECRACSSKSPRSTTVAESWQQQMRAPAAALRAPWAMWKCAGRPPLEPWQESIAIAIAVAALFAMCPFPSLPRRCSCNTPSILMCYLALPL